MADDVPQADRAQSAGSTLPGDDSPPTNGSPGNRLLKRLSDVPRWVVLTAVLLALVGAALVLLQLWPGVAVISATAFLMLVVYALSFMLSDQAFWGWLLIGSVLVFVVSLAWQAGVPRRVLSQQAWLTRPVSVDSTQLHLAISYPRKAPLVAQDQPGLPLFVYFQSDAVPITSTLTPSTTAAVTVTPSPVATPPTVTPTPATNAIITETGSISFTLAFIPQTNGLVFTDEEGVPVLPQLAVRMGEQSPETAALYVSGVSNDRDPPSIDVNLVVQAMGTGSAWQPLGAITIGSESPYAAWWRHFSGLVFGLATPLLAVVATLIGFVWQLWQGQRRRHAQRLVSINQVWAAMRESPVSGARRYYEILHKAKDEDWPADLAERLEDCRKMLTNSLQHIRIGTLKALQERQLQETEVLLAVANDVSQDTRDSDFFRKAAGIALAYAEDPQTGWKHLQDIGVAESITALVATIDSLGQQAEKVLIRPLADLAGREVTVLEVERQLSATKHGRELLQSPQFERPLTALCQAQPSSDAKDAACRLVQLRKDVSPWLRPYLWPQDRPASKQNLETWLASVSLDFNPFGPKSAELDSRLTEYCFDTVFSNARGRFPVLAGAAPGAGRTAAALTIAHYCDYPPEGPAETQVFPVYYVPPATKSTSADVNIHHQALSAAVSRWLVKWIAAKPKAFADMSKSRLICLTHLLGIGLGSFSNISYALHMANPDAEMDHILREMKSLIAGGASSGSSREDWPELLMSALPKAYDCVYVLCDVPTPDAPESEDKMVDALAPLIAMAVPLAAKGVYLKLFAPNRIADRLSAPPGCNRMTISWDEDALGGLLAGRVQRKKRRIHFNELFDTTRAGDDPEKLLVRAAAAHEDAPRRLIRLGNVLLATHASERPDEKQIDVAELQTVIDSLA